jgi:putative phage-type endonuclease
MQVHNIFQGTPEWHAYRASHFNASDAPAMMGCSAYKTRTELLHELHTGTTPTVNKATQRRFDEGHRIEALARPLAEKIIGEDLYPVVGSLGELSASFDGLTMTEETGFEHKTLNDELRSAMRDEGNGYNLPPQYQVQMEQQLLVSGAERILFMATKWDGDTLVEKSHCWYASDPKLRTQIVAGWAQFAKELAAYVPAEVIVPAVAAPQMGLPAVSINVTGSIALVDNLEKFGTALTAYVERINKTPETDQDFADLEATVKTLKTAEDALDAAEAGALAQTDSIDTMRRTVALYRDTARTNRLMIEKLVKAEKENRRVKIVSDAVAALHAHMNSLAERTRNCMPVVPNQFQDVIKGLKSLDSMKDKVSGELARCKIEANAIADRIQHNIALLDDEVEFGFLFPDFRTLVLKAADDFTALVKSRIADHKTAEAAKEEATRSRIQAEEQAKAEKAAREKMEAEQAAATTKAAQDRKDAEWQERYGAMHPNGAPKYSKTTFRDDGVPIMLNDDGKRSIFCDLDQDAEPAAAPEQHITHEAVVAVMPPAVRQAMEPKTNSAPAMTLGNISERLGFNVTSAFLASLGYGATTVKAAKLYHEEDFPVICRALIEHIESVCEMQAA